MGGGGEFLDSSVLSSAQKHLKTSKAVFSHTFKNLHQDDKKTTTTQVTKSLAKQLA